MVEALSSCRSHQGSRQWGGISLELLHVSEVIKAVGNGEAYPWNCSMSQVIKAVGNGEAYPWNCSMSQKKAGHFYFCDSFRKMGQFL